MASGSPEKCLTQTWILLPCKFWPSVNRIRPKPLCQFANSQFAHRTYRWGLKDSAMCVCGEYVVNEIPLNLFAGRIDEVYRVTPEALDYLADLEFPLTPHNRKEEDYG